MRCGKFYADGGNRIKVVISFHTHDNLCTPVVVAGALYAPRGDNPILRCIDMQWLKHSQVPCLRLKVIRGANRTPTFAYIFGRDMQPTATARNGCEFACVRMADDNYGVDLHPDVRTALDSSSESSLWETKISVNHAERTSFDDKSQASTWTNRLKTTGIDAADLRQVLETGNLAAIKGDPDILSPGNWTL